MGLYNGNPIDECTQINDDLGAIILHLMRSAVEIGDPAGKRIANAVGCLVEARCHLEAARVEALRMRNAETDEEECR